MKISKLPAAIFNKNGLMVLVVIASFICMILPLFIPNKFPEGKHVFVDGYNVKGIVYRCVGGETEIYVFDKEGKPTLMKVRTALLKDE